jgi:hypothetical protein
MNVHYCWCVIDFQYLEQEKKSREFHANPVPPSIKLPSTVKESSVHSTEPSPFQLEVDKRGKIKREQLKQKVTIWTMPQGQKKCLML